MMNRMTSLGMDERLERVLAYSLGSLKRLSGLDPPAGMVDERRPGITALGPLVGDNHPLGLVDHHGLCKRRLSFTLRQRIRALLGVNR